MHPLPEIGIDGEVELRRVERADLADLRGVRELTDGKLEQFEARVDAGRDCFMTALDGRPAHYAWVQRQGVHPVHSLARGVTVEPGEAWLFDCRTARWARRRGLYTWTLVALLDRLAGEGIRVARIYTTRDNIASRRGIISAGFERDEVRTLLSWGPLRLRLPRRSSSVPRATRETGSE